ncbi:MAG: DUF1015 domain-containing protein [Treponemataceae bacterium]
MNNDFSKYGLHIEPILIPSAKIDKKKWATVACDQFTHDKDYWHSLEDEIGSAPSTLHMIFPEAFLEDGDEQQRIKNIHAKMNEYCQHNYFSAVNGMIYIERTTAYNRTRQGLVTLVDLEEYEWDDEKKALIRATEATILERIPPRVKIRNGASLEIPHIMLLLNDEKKTLLDSIAQKVDRNNSLYETDLIKNSGHLKGFLVDEQCYSEMQSHFENLYRENTNEKGDTFLFAVGDGNHSLATAKTILNDYKKKYPDAVKNSPLRYALVEIVNIFDDGLTFEPIHRALFGVAGNDLLDFFSQNLSCNIEKISTTDELEKKVINAITGFSVSFMSENHYEHYFVKTNTENLLVSTLQPLLDTFLHKNQSVKIDYIHGSTEVFKLAQKKDTVGILLPEITKKSFFATIEQTGSLPRKSFSMGEASEKRFYFESRKIVTENR